VKDRAMKFCIHLSLAGSKWLDNLNACKRVC
jgi:hypothetical protein